MYRIIFNAYHIVGAYRDVLKSWCIDPSLEMPLSYYSYKVLPGPPLAVRQNLWPAVIIKLIYKANDKPRAWTHQT